MFDICMVFGPWGGGHGGHMYHMNDFESPAPKDDSCQVGKNPTMRSQEVDETVTFYIGPPPQPLTPHQGPIEATLGTAMNNFYSSPKKVHVHVYM